MEIAQIIAKAKAEAIIVSCKNSDQFNTAANYVQRYKSLFNDGKGYNELLSLLKDYRINSLYPEKILGII